MTASVCLESIAAALLFRRCRCFRATIESLMVWLHHVTIHLSHCSNVRWGVAYVCDLPKLVSWGLAGSQHASGLTRQLAEMTPWWFKCWLSPGQVAAIHCLWVKSSWIVASHHPAYAYSAALAAGTSCVWRPTLATQRSCVLAAVTGIGLGGCGVT